MISKEEALEGIKPLIEEHKIKKVKLFGTIIGENTTAEDEI